MSGPALAAIDAALVALSLVCLVLGRRAVRGGRVDAHRRYMLAAFAASAVFLPLFVHRVARHGVETMRVDGPRHAGAFTVMVLHDGVAVASVPLAIVALGLALAGRYSRHREVARVAWPLWVWSCATGLLAFVVLYARR